MKTEGVLLQLNQVRYTYPGWPPVVDGVDWDVMPGEIHCLVGRSGCGKTSLLKLAAGLIQPASGRVLLGQSVVHAPQPDVGFVFQSPTLLDWLSALDNVPNMPVPTTCWRASACLSACSKDRRNCLADSKAAWRSRGPW
jgi:NitT/TauT family transport system ATP-binding protein